jgi:hypothetical protein
MALYREIFDFNNTDYIKKAITTKVHVIEHLQKDAKNPYPHDNNQEWAILG